MDYSNVLSQIKEVEELLKSPRRKKKTGPKKKIKKTRQDLLDEVTVIKPKRHRKTNQEISQERKELKSQRSKAQQNIIARQEASLHCIYYDDCLNLIKTAHGRMICLNCQKKELKQDYYKEGVSQRIFINPTRDIKFLSHI